MPRLSIILPVVGDPTQMEDTLVSVLENRPSDCEILVVTNQPYGDPYALAGEVRFVQATPQCGLLGCVNLGLAAARSPIAHVLQCGVLAEENWANEALECFCDPSVAAVVPLVVAADNPERVAAAGWRCGAAGQPRPSAAGKPVRSAPKAAIAVEACDLAAVFYRRDVIEEFGWLNLRMGERLAGIDLSLTLRRAGYRCLLEPRARVYETVTRRVAVSAVRRGWENERFFWRWAPSTGWGRSLAAHTIAVMAELLAHGLRPDRAAGLLAGRCAAALTFWTHRAHWRMVEQLQPTTPPTSEKASAARPSRAAA